MLTPSGLVKKHLLEKALCSLPRPQVLVDAGCSGAIISADLDAGIRIGLDISLNLSRRVRRKVQGVQCDIGSIPLRRNSVDCIICLDLVEHVEDDKALLSQFFELMKSDGFLVLSTPVRDVEYVSAKLLRDLLGLDSATLNRDFGHVRSGYCSEELENLLKSQGFCVVAQQFFNGALTRTLDLLVYRNLLKFYNRRCSFVETNYQRRKVRRGKYIDYIENIHDVFVPLLLGGFSKLGERGAKVEHFMLCKKRKGTEDGKNKT